MSAKFIEVREFAKKDAEPFLINVDHIVEVRTGHNEEFGGSVVVLSDGRELHVQASFMRMSVCLDVQTIIGHDDC